MGGDDGIEQEKRLHRAVPVVAVNDAIERIDLVVQHFFFHCVEKQLKSVPVPKGSARLIPVSSAEMSFKRVSVVPSSFSTFAPFFPFFAFFFAFFLEIFVFSFDFKPSSVKIVYFLNSEK